jgi:hypothetical protein
MTAMLPLPFLAIAFKYFMVEKLVLNVLSDTVFAALAELTLGSMATTKLPVNATAARALPVLKFIFPNPSLTSDDVVSFSIP